MWNTIMVDKAFCQSTYGRNIAYREGKFVSRVYSSKSKMLSFLWWMWSNVIILPLGCWLSTLGSNAIVSYPGFSIGQLLADWALSNGSNQVGFGEWKFMVLILCIVCISATITFMVMKSLGSNRSIWGKKLTGIYTSNFIHLIIKILLIWYHLLMSIHLQKISIFFSHSERTTYILLP